jgi:uncharacterized SAM-binding protein YcdF (DUF218 family)
MDTPPADARSAIDAAELRLLEDQLTRMRGMLFGYSERFFERIRTYLLITLALLGVLLWLAGMRGMLDLDNRDLLVPAAIVWTGAIALYLVMTFLFRHDERRLLAELDAAYGPKGDPPAR